MEFALEAGDALDELGIDDLKILVRKTSAQLHATESRLSSVEANLLSAEAEILSSALLVQTMKMQIAQ